MAKSKSRPERWAALVADLQQQRGIIEGAVAAFNDTLDDFRALQGEYEEWRDNLPENLQQSALAEKLEEVCNIGLYDIDEPDFSPLDEAENIDLPRGFGRD